MKKTFTVGVVGCGDISTAYLQQMRRFEILNVLACSDLERSKAESQAGRFNVPKVLDTEALLADPAIDLVLNLTPPAAHAPVSLAALESGKHVYSEKPLAHDRESGQRLIETAAKRDRLIGCAPDTFMGAGIQTVIQRIGEGAIGEPVSATAFMACHGHEHWHPSPDFYYRPGGGPLFDMGPYYLTALCTVLGPVRRVCGSTQTSLQERIVSSGPFEGRRIPVQTPTHLSAVLDFACGAMATLIMSFDVWHHHLPLMEIHGTAGSLSVPDPNTFGGPVSLSLADEGEWKEIPLARPYAEDFRGVGLADMAHAIRTGRPHRANGAIAYHVLDVMEAVYDSTRLGRHVEVRSTMEVSAPMRTDLPEGNLDA